MPYQSRSILRLSRSLRCSILQKWIHTTPRQQTAPWVSRNIAGLVIALCLVFGVGTPLAQAGKILGKVTFEESDETAGSEEGLSKSERLYEKLKNQVVIWITDYEGEFEVPDKKPTLMQGGGQFHPPLLVIVAGQTVDMPNNDLTTHNVYSKSKPKQFDLGMYPKGESKSVTFESPGLVKLKCSMHRSMRAKIMVLPNLFFDTVGAGKPYRISKIPAGEYTVSAWRDGFEMQKETVTVEEKGTVKLNFHLVPKASK